MRLGGLMLLLGLLAAEAVAWHLRLAGDGGGFWQTRAVIVVTNQSAQPLRGAPVVLPIGSKLPSLPFAGKEAKAIRICDERGRELKFDLRTPDGLPRREGLLQAGDHLSFLAEVPAKSQARFFAYADNPHAWRLPDFLRTGLINGSFESGEKDPTDWERLEEDDAHQLAWVEGVARTGKRSVQTRVTENAPPTWVKFAQHHIPVTPNTTYRLLGWVKAEKVKGTAGWFIHVFGERGEWLINQVLNAGDGTYDWRPIEWTFTVPENGRWATVGTVLYGTGTAWFDDVSLEPLTKGEPILKTTVANVETISLTPLLKPSVWADAKIWRERVPIVVRHLGDTATEALVYADLRKVLWRYSSLQRPVGIRIVDPTMPAAKRVCSHLRWDNGVLFLAHLPPKSVKRFDLYLSTTAPNDGEMHYETLLHSKANLIPNPSFEQGNELPIEWRGDRGEGIVTERTREARWGQWAAKLFVAPERHGQWLGWRLKVSVKPLQTYFYCGFIKAEGERARFRLHGHWHNAQHQLVAEAPFFSTNPEAAGGQGWVQTSALVESPADAAFAELHLTTNTEGHFWHDGIFFGEVHLAVVGDREQPAVAPEKGFRVWFVNPLVRVFPNTLPEGLPSSLEVLMARNEWEPIQLALRSDRPIARVSVAVTPLRHATGQTLPPPEIWRVGYVPVDHPSGYYSSTLPIWYRHRPSGQGSSDGWAGEWADPLIPFAPFPLSPNRTEAVWLILFVPPEAATGRYEGELVITADQQTVKVPLSVEVVPLTLPQETELTVILDLRGDGRIQRGLRKWYRFLARYRVSPGLVYPDPTFRYEDGKVQMEASGFDETVQLLVDELKVNTLYTPWFLYSFGWNYPPRRFFNLEPFTPEYTQAYQQLLRTFFDHVRQRGWTDRFVYYLSDEPHFWHEPIRQQLRRLCELAHQAVPDIRIYASVWSFVPDWVGALDIWGIGPHGSCSVEDMGRLKQSGATLWFTTDGHMCIDTPYLAIERLLPYLCFRYGVAGYEFWGVSWWTYDPWDYGWHAYISQSEEGERFYWIRYPNGDGYLAYPGERWGHDGPLPSIRLVQVREGIEDYLVLRTVERMLREGQWTGQLVERAKQVLEQAKALVTIPNQGGLRSTSLMPNPEAVPQLRRAALELWRMVGQ